MKHGSTLIYSFILLVGDFLALLAAFVLAYILRVKYDDRPLPQQIPAHTYLFIFAVLLVFWLVIFMLLDLYRSRVFENRFSEAGRILAGSFIGILFLVGVQYALNRPIFPARLVPIYGLGLSFLLVLLFRTIARGIRHSLYSHEIGLNHILLVGSTDVTKELTERLSHPGTGFKIIGVVGDRRVSYEAVDDQFKYSDFETAIDHLKHTTIHSIVQTELFSDNAQNDEVLTYAQENHIAYRFVPGNSNMFVGKLDVDLFQNIPVVTVHQTALIGWGRVAKRLFDLLFGSILLVIALPIFAVTWVFQKLFDRGPFLYRQKRITRYGTEIKLYKIRSLKTKYSGSKTPEEVFAEMGRPELARQYRANGDYLEKDPRISAFGRLIRKTSIDELPQLLNVLKGDLSMVGPRPLIAQEIDKADKKSIILSVKSGLTGLAAVSGRRDLPYEERRKLDQYYVQNWSFWLDLTIILKTIVMVLRGSGAR